MSDEASRERALNAALEELERGDWRRAHELVQDETGTHAAWIHAHVHRIEGDEANAAYWYERARKPYCREPLDSELRAIRAAVRPQ
jgi:hypothetical protein